MTYETPNPEAEPKPQTAANAAFDKTTAQIENNFTYHAPKPGQPERYEALRAKARELAHLINEICPNSREKSVTLTEL